MEQVIIGGHRTLDEFGMRLKMGFSMQPPTPREMYVEVPGRDGALDLTESLIGFPNYGQRTTVLPFSVYGDSIQDIEAKKTDIARAFNGMRMDYSVPSLPGFTLNGRITVEFGEPSPVKSDVTLTIVGDPWMRRNPVVEKFNAAPSVTKTFMSGTRPQRVFVTASSPVTVTFNKKTINFPAGTDMTNDALVFTAGENLVKFVPSDWDFYIDGETLVVNDGKVALGNDYAAFSGGFDSVSGDVLMLDDAKSTVTIRYEWEDL